MQRRLLAVSLAWRAAAVALLVGTRLVQRDFDSSATLLRHTLGTRDSAWAWDALAVPFCRWDTLYFVAAARFGYTYEQMLAFQPGIVGVLRLAGALTAPWSATAAVLVATALANVATAVSPLLLYRLTRRHMPHKFAYTAALLSVFAPASMSALAAPTPEPFFSVFSLAGMLLLDGSVVGDLLGAASFAAATLFRANGILLAGYVVWHVYTRRASVPWAALLIAVGVAPFIAFQAWAHTRLCPGQPWCTAVPPLVYSYVQRMYWDVGPFRYWTLAQVPNFILAAPVVGFGAVQAFAYLRTVPLHAYLPWSAHRPWALPYVVHMAVLCTLLFVASHVQIALRFATPGGMPALWWALAAAVGGRGGDTFPALRVPLRAVVGYLAVYAVIAGVLYAGFYPPA